MRTSAGNWPVKVKTRRMSGLYLAIAEAVVKICRDFYGRITVSVSGLYFKSPKDFSEMKHKARKENNVSRTNSTVNVILLSSNAVIRSLKFLGRLWLRLGS